MSRLLSLSMILLLTAVLAGDVRAQQRDSGHGSDLNLPSWSAPNQHTQPATPPHARLSSPESAQQPSAPPGFGDPVQAPEAPLGGLEWLALAGGAYAVNRLRRRNRDVGSSDDGRADG